jgi:hypothetical protein
MGAVATLKHTVKSATETADKQQQAQRQQQPKKSPSSAAFQPVSIANCNAWDFHPLIGGLMDSVMSRRR